MQRRKSKKIFSTVLGIIIAGSCLALIPLSAGKLGQSGFILGLTLLIAILVYIFMKRRSWEENPLHEMDEISKEYKRKYNFSAFFIFFVIGSIIGGLIYSGLIFGVIAWLFQRLLEIDIRLPSSITSVTCSGIFWIFLLLIPTILISRYLYRAFTRYRNRHKKSEYDEYFANLSNRSDT